MCFKQPKMPTFRMPAAAPAPVVPANPDPQQFILASQGATPGATPRTARGSTKSLRIDPSLQLPSINPKGLAQAGLAMR